ncbi:MAG: tRNA-dihydrouridine synthase family protein [Rectinema sp.]
MIFFPRGSLLLAPMVGITNRAFRTLVQELGGADWYTTEMASAEAFLAGGRNEAVYLDPAPCPSHTSVQFTARTPESLAAACRALSKIADVQRPAGIDINMGCSAPHIKGSGRGAALLDTTARAREMVAAARENWTGILSAKIRLSSVQGEDGTIALAKSLAKAGLDFLVVHARFDTQKFRRKADHGFALLLAQELSIPVIANGDISTAEECRSLLASGKIHSLMIGRAAVREPWLFKRLHAALAGRSTCPPETYDLLAIGLRYIELVEMMLPSEWQKETCRRVFWYYADNVSFAHHLRFSLINASTLDAMRACLTRYFDEVPQDRFR